MGRSRQRVAEFADATFERGQHGAATSSALLIPPEVARAVVVNHSSIQ
jgi:hypothetical protein